MAPSGPCGSDRLDTSLTSSGSALALVVMQYRSQSGAEQPRKLARRLLHKIREAQARGTLRRPVWRRVGLRLARGGRSGVREGPYGESDTDHQQQELFLMV